MSREEFIPFTARREEAERMRREGRRYSWEASDPLNSADGRDLLPSERLAEWMARRFG